MTTAIWSPVSMSSYFDPANGSVKQVSVYFYRAGTLDPITVWTTSNQAIPHPIPVISTGYGRVPPVWIGTEGNPAYRFRVFDQYSTLVEDVDNIPGPEFYVGPGEGEEGGTILPGDPRLNATGDIVYSYSNKQPRVGWVMCNGAAIGPTGSTNVAAGGRANDDTKDLFFWLWGQDVANGLHVIPSKGSTAQGDWDLKKAIETPDLQGRVVVGVDAMGVPAKNRLTGVPFIGGGQPTLGSTGGEALHTLTAAQVPDHFHTAVQDAHTHSSQVPAHTHTATSTASSENAAHSHSGSTGTESTTHTHSVPSGGGTSTAGPGATSTFTTQAGTSTGGQSTNHTHSFTTGTESTNHQHTVSTTVNLNGPWTALSDSKQPLITVSATTGGGAAHNTTPLFLLLTAYIKL